MTRSDRQFFAQAFSTRPSEPPPRLVSEYIQGRRKLPPNEPFPGPWDNWRAPYGIEFQDDASPFSPIQHSVTMKARKIGFTTFAENIAAYWTDAFPTDWAYTSASEDLVKDWSERKFDEVIDSCGFRHKIGITTQTRATKRSGDTGSRKEFAGGAGDFYSIMSKMATRAQNKRLILRDEIDAAESIMTTGEGNRYEVNKAHTNSWGARRKIIDFSSPTTHENSVIYQEYLLGDCRKFMVPCPYCGAFQELVFAFDPDQNFGLKADTKAGVLERAYYLCDFCHEAFFNTDKKWMYQPDPRCKRHPEKTLGPCHYEPTKPSSDPTYRSRQISALVAPVGMISWTEIYREKLKADDNPSLAPSFTNLLLGLPYKETGTRPAMQTMLSLRGDYHERQIPEGVLYLTAGIDAQQGSAKDENNPARLEMEIKGHGVGYRTWSITYQIFHGDTSDAFSGAWEKLYQWFANGKASFTARGLNFPVNLVFVDSGNRPEVTYQFCSRVHGFFPIKGMPLSKMVANAKNREAGVTPGGFVFYRLAKVDSGSWIYELNVSLYKKGIYADLGRSGSANRVPGQIQRPSFADFPFEYPDEYFKGLASEEAMADGSFKQIRDRNEPLDCFVYAKAAGHVYLDMLVASLRETAKKNGANAYQVGQLGAKEALEYLSRRLGQSNLDDKQSTE